MLEAGVREVVKAKSEGPNQIGEFVLCATYSGMLPEVQGTIEDSNSEKGVVVKALGYWRAHIFPSEFQFIYVKS